VRDEGVYDITNALVTSNGRIEVRIDGRTKVVPRGGWLRRFALYV